MFLEVDGISRTYGTLKALEQVSFAVEKGELVSIVGPSGAGKTTLLKILAGLEKADRGVVRSSVNLAESPAILVFQDYLLFPSMSIFENVAFGLKCRRTERHEQSARVHAMLDYFQLSDKAWEYPNQLSAGQQQRVALARAMVVSPSILLLDEPFANLDRNLKADTAEFIRGFQQEYRITTVSVTHDLQEAFMMSDKIGIMLDGRLRQFDTVKTVYNRPVSHEVAAFLGHINRIPAACFAALNFASGDSPPCAGISVRAEGIDLHRAGQGGGVVSEVVFAGQFIIYRVDLADIRVTVYSFNPEFAVGDRVVLEIKQYIQLEENNHDQPETSGPGGSRPAADVLERNRPGGKRYAV